MRPGLALTEVSAEHERVHIHPNGCTANAASRDRNDTEVFLPAGLPTNRQPAIELFERPLMCFLNSIRRLH
jgi:hypothetical protein